MNLSQGIICKTSWGSVIGLTGESSTPHSSQKAGHCTGKTSPFGIKVHWYTSICITETVYMSFQTLADWWHVTALHLTLWSISTRFLVWKTFLKWLVLIRKLGKEWYEHEINYIDVLLNHSCLYIESFIEVHSQHLIKYAETCISGNVTKNNISSLTFNKIYGNFKCFQL